MGLARDPEQGGVTFQAGGCLLICDGGRLQTKCVTNGRSRGALAYCHLVSLHA